MNRKMEQSFVAGLQSISCRVNYEQSTFSVARNNQTIHCKFSVHTVQRFWCFAELMMSDIVSIGFNELFVYTCRVLHSNIKSIQNDVMPTFYFGFLQIVFCCCFVLILCGCGAVCLWQLKTVVGIKMNESNKHFRLAALSNSKLTNLLYITPWLNRFLMDKSAIVKNSLIDQSFFFVSVVILARFYFNAMRWLHATQFTHKKKKKIYWIQKEAWNDWVKNEILIKTKKKNPRRPSSSQLKQGKDEICFNRILSSGISFPSWIDEYCHRCHSLRIAHGNNKV